MRAILRETLASIFDILKLFGIGGRKRLVWCMAIYRLEAKIISRGSGHSAVAAAAYRTGTKIRDERMGRTQDYSSRTKGVVASLIVKSANSPEWAAHTDSLWNTVEKSEKRKDAQLAREFVLAVPKELSAKEQFQLAVDWVQSNLVSKGMIAEVSLHQPKGGRNPHIHVLCTMRTIDGDKFSAKKPREWNAKEVLLGWRESWCAAENAALEKAGRPERVDHRSLKAQGIDREPQPKIGQEATAMERCGLVEDTEKARQVRRVNLMNAVRPFVRAIQRYGEIKPLGMGNTWWQRSSYLVSRIKARASEAVKNTWTKLINSQRNKENQNDNEHNR